MPIQSNNFSSFNDTSAADRAYLETVGSMCEQAVRANYHPSGIGVVTGNLQRSQTHVVSGDHVDIGATADYAGHVHNGTSRKAGRPWIKNAAEANRDAILQRGVEAWKAVME